MLERDLLSDALSQALREEVQTQLAPLLKRIEALEGDRRKHSTSMRRDDGEFKSIRARLDLLEKKIRRELDDTQETRGRGAFMGPPPVIQEGAEHPETTWSDLRRDEKRLRNGRRVLALLKYMRANCTCGPSAVRLTEASIMDALVGLASAPKPALITMLLDFDLHGTIPSSGVPLDALIDELDEHLYYEGRLLAAER